MWAIYDRMQMGLYDVTWISTTPGYQGIVGPGWLIAGLKMTPGTLHCDSKGSPWWGDLVLTIPSSRSSDINSESDKIDAPTGARLSEGGKPPDAYAALRCFSRTKLKGQERAVLEALCNANGRLPICDLAVKDGVGWDDEIQGFKDVQRRLKPKLKQQGWTLARQDGAASLNSIGAKEATISTHSSPD